MSIRAQIAIQTGPEEWAHTYVHFDGYPEHMLLALAPWTPQDILAAREIRQVTTEVLDYFDAPRAPHIRHDRPASSHIYTYGRILAGSTLRTAPNDPLAIIEH
jgi:hypothetical protein